jgi:hypothetical protein
MRTRDDAARRGRQDSCSRDSTPTTLVMLILTMKKEKAPIL